MRISYFSLLMLGLAACSPHEPAHDDAWFNTPDGTWTPDSGVVSKMKSALDLSLGTALDQRPSSDMQPVRYWFQYFGYGSGTDKSIAIAGGPFPVPKNAGATFRGAFIPEDCHISATYRPREGKFSQFALGGFHCPPRLTLTLARTVITKKLTKAEKLVNEQMLAMLEWAADNPKRWHNIGKLEATQKAAELLAKRGVIEIWAETQLYRLKPKK